MWGSKPSPQWENLFGIIVLQFLGSLPGGYGIDFIGIVPLPLPWLLCLWMWVLFFGVFQHPPVDSEQLVAILVLLQEEMSARPSTPPS